MLEFNLSSSDVGLKHKARQDRDRAASRGSVTILSYEYNYVKVDATNGMRERERGA